MKLKILRASRYFTVTPLTDEALRVCLHFQHRFRHQKFSTDKDQPAPVTFYSAALHDNSEFRFHRNTLQNFMNFLSDRNYKESDYEVTDKEYPFVKKRTIPVLSKWTDRDYQVPIVGYLIAPLPPAKFIGIQTGKGKATSVDELLKTPDGWKRMGDIQVGDEVIAKDGSTTLCTGVYPQGVLQLYTVTFSDGRSIECCGEHLWKVYYIEFVDNGYVERYEVVNTYRVMALLSSGLKEVHIDLCDPEPVPEVQLPEDPYTYGLTLGRFGGEMEDIYLSGSIEQRQSLMKGICDGIVVPVFSSENLLAAQKVQQLVWSLGGLARLDSHSDGNFVFFKTKREGVELRLGVSSIVLGRKAEAQCISIDHPDRLYVTTNYVVTHNTYCSLRGISEAGLRTAIIVEGGMVTKWGKDVLQVLDIKAKNTLCVRGGNQLRGLIGMAGSKELEKVDVILISSNTLQDWITTHETLADRNNKDVGYGIEPSEFYEKLEIGHRLIDEVHKRFHFNFKQDLYCNAPMVTSLSATLFSYDKTMESFYEIAYPKAERYDGGELDKYIKTYAVMWRPKKGRRIKATEYGRSTYSHIAVEKSIMRNKELMDNYFEMIAETLEQGYVPNYKEGNKAAVFVASTDMATALVKFLRKRFPQYSCERYASSTGDPYDNLMNPDLRVTTLGSGGTGHDMPGLTDTILTVGIMSLQANIQVLGRLRFIADQETRFYYMTCLDLDAQMRYHGLKMKLMEERAKSFEIMNYNIEL